MVFPSKTYSQSVENGLLKILCQGVTAHKLPNRVACANDRQKSRFRHGHTEKLLKTLESCLLRCPHGPNLNQRSVDLTFDKRRQKMSSAAARLLGSSWTLRSGEVLRLLAKGRPLTSGLLFVGQGLLSTKEIVLWGGYASTPVVASPLISCDAISRQAQT